MQNSRWAVWFGASVVGSLVLLGCSHELTGPQPTLEEPAQSVIPVDPGIVCRDQMATTVAVHGDKFSPVPIDVPKAPRAALPTIMLERTHELDGQSVSTPDELIYSGDPKRDSSNAFDSDGQPLLFWISQMEMRFVVNQTLTLAKSSDEGLAPVGVWDVQLQNPDGDTAESKQAFAVVDRPMVSAVAPGITCLAQGDRTLMLSGSTFLQNGGDSAVLEVDGTNAPFALDLSDCTQIMQADLMAQVCQTAKATLAQDSIDPGFPALDLHNPATAACKSTDDLKLRVVPPPAIDHVSPALGCVTEQDRAFAIHGSDFLVVDGTNPKVTIGTHDFAVDSMSDCEDLETQGHKVSRCKTIQITVAKGSLDPDLYAVTVQNPDPAGCDNTASAALRIVPPPALQSVDPPLVCVDDAQRVITVHGSEFLVIDGQVPSVTVDDAALTASAISPQDCTELEVTGSTVQTCATLLVTLAEGSVMQGKATIKVTNPDPAGCSDERSDLLTVVPGPSIASVAPALVCTDDGSKALVITGTGFLKVGGDLPKVKIGGGAVQSVDSIAGCSNVETPTLMVQACTELHVSVAKNALSAGRPSVEVTNPDPAGCTIKRSDVLTVPPSLNIATLAPLNVCQGTSNAAFPITLMGAGFVRAGGADPTLSFGGAPVAPTFSACTQLDVAGANNVSTCDTINATVDLTGKTSSPTDLPVVVSTSDVPACSLTATTYLHVVAPPTVSMIDILSQPIDDAVCSNKSFTIAVTGTGFVAGSTVTFSNSHNQSVSANTVTVMSATALTATFDNGLPYDAIDPTYDLTVATADNCSGPPLANVVRVDPTPLVFFVDPSIAYNAITIDATVFTSGLSAQSMLSTIELIGPGAATTSASLQVVSNTTTNPNRIVARIPGINGGTQLPTFAPGDYSVRVTSVLGCSGQLDGGLKVTATTDSSVLTSIAPSFVSPNNSTAVVVDGGGLLSMPRLYLTPASGSGTAQALRAVELQSASRLSAIVPSGLSAGNYNLILVNPDGKVGVLANGVTVTTGAPPTIDNVVPASLVPNASTTVTVSGSGFNVASVQLECKPTPTSTTITTVSGTLNGTPSASQVKVDLNPGAAGVTTGVCLLKLTNQDGAFYEYSAVSLTNSSLNLSPWTDGTALTTPRRALSLVAGRPTGTSRFVYAIGGDNGVSGAGNQASIGTTVHNDVEAANVDVFGNLGSWAVQTRTLLPAPRTWAGAQTIGRFIYLVGGHDGSSATDTLLRAQILDPLATSEIDDLDASLSDGTTGLGGGLYYYAVAALFPSNDASNPSGESLRGELLPVQLPSRTEKILLTLTWKPVAGAHGYRIYRSPAPGNPVSALALLAETTCGAGNALCTCDTTPSQCQLLDNGSTTPSGNGPLPAGSLGTWHAVDGARCTSANCLLGSAREGLTTATANHPTDASKHFLFAFGGRNGTGTYLNTYEVATVTVAMDGTQTVSDWVAGSQTLSSARAELGAWVLSADNSNIIRTSSTPSAVWIYLGGGRSAAGTTDTALEAGLVQASGDLGTFVTANITSLKSGLTGFGFGASNDRLYTFGGNATSADGSSASVCSGSGGGCAGALPDLPNNAWNALGNASTSRIYMGVAQESAFYYLAGGWFSGSTLSSTQQTIQ